MMSWQMRQMVAEDVRAIERLLAQSPEAAQWSQAVFLRAHANGTDVWVAEESGDVIGMVAARAAGGEAEILNLAVFPQHRRRGLGRSLMEYSIASVRAAGATSIFLEVREGNFCGRAFYAAIGFVPTGRRRAYYRDPIEDAIVLSLGVNPA